MKKILAFVLGVVLTFGAVSCTCSRQEQVTEVDAVEVQIDSTQVDSLAVDSLAVDAVPGEENVAL